MDRLDKALLVLRGVLELDSMIIVIKIISRQMSTSGAKKINWNEFNVSAR